MRKKKKKKKPSSVDSDALAKWETKREKAAGEIFLAVESDQRVHFRGLEEEPTSLLDLLLPSSPLLYCVFCPSLTSSCDLFFYTHTHSSFLPVEP